MANRTGQPPPDDGRPDQLSKPEITEGLSRVRPGVDECFRQLGITIATAKVNLTIERNGAVSKAQVTRELADSPVRACLEQVVRTATFPPFRGSPQTITYTFYIRLN